MHVFPRIVLLLDWLVALAWLWRVLSWRHNLKRVPDLTRGADDPSLVLPRFSVIVPARNEASGIAATLLSLLHSEGVDLEILAVDDRSEDATGDIMDRVAEELAAPGSAIGKSLRVLHITELPQDWLGKTHAMAFAARQATGEWLLFTDGDVLFRPDALRRALAFAVASEADHLVLMPTLLLESWGERMMMGFLQVMSIWTVRLWRVPDPRARRDVLGVGAFNMIRRRVYDAVGGWEPLRMEVIEDLALGTRVKGSGFTQCAVLGRGLVSVRWVRGTFGVLQSLAKNLFAFFSFRAELLIGFLPVFVLFTLFPLAAILTGSAAYWATGVMLCAVWLAYQRQAKYQPFSAWVAGSFPVASVLIFYTLVRSMIVVLKNGGILWRGTFYPLSELRKNRK